MALKPASQTRVRRNPYPHDAHKPLQRDFPMNARYWARKIQELTNSLWAKRPESVCTPLDERLAILAALSQDWVWFKDSTLKFIEITAAPSLQPEIQGVIGKRLRELPVRGVSDEAWRDHETTLLRQEPFTGFIVEAMISAQWRRILMCGAGSPRFQCNK